MENDMRTEREYIVRERLIGIDEKGIRHCVCVEVGELIRCKDCKHSEVLRYRDGSDIRTCILSSRISIFEDDFCSRGERREEDNE